MSNFVIVTDSTTDLPPAFADECGLEIIPYIYTLGGKEYHNYLDYREQPVKTFYDELREGKTATTTQVTAHRFMEVWRPMLEKGHDILYICLSSGLSKTYEQSVLAQREAAETFPDRKVITIDSRSASIGQGLLAYHAFVKKGEGMSLEDTAVYIENLIPHLHQWVMADDLHHLRRGGRVSGAAAFVGTVLNVKPIIAVVEEGLLVPQTKVRGRAKAIDLFLEKMDEYEMDPKDQMIFIAHSDSEDMANAAKDAISKKYGIKNFMINNIGPVIGAHTGPGTINVNFIGKKVRVKKDAV